jgi:hypothetical protein
LKCSLVVWGKCRGKACLLKACHIPVAGPIFRPGAVSRRRLPRPAAGSGRPRRPRRADHG